MKSGKTTSRSEKTVSIASKVSDDIQPVVYSFKVMGGGLESGSVMTAVRPPHWLYHDHALGVIWMLFHNDKNYIGITQLHWCLRFLLDLKNSEGEYTGDVDICIRVIQDDLIEQYAKLGTALESSTEEKSLRKEKSGKVSSKPSRSTIPEEYVGIAESTRINFDQDKVVAGETVTDEEKTSTSPDTIASTGEDKQGETDGENSHTKSVQKERGTLSLIPEAQFETSTINEKDDRANVEHCEVTACGTSTGIKKKQKIVSFTYNEMISRGPAPCTEQHSIVDLFDETGFFDDSSKTKSDETKHPKDRSEKSLADSSTKEMVEFLNSSRQQHIERIKKEIERLYGLERFMENINAHGFSAYVTEDLAKRMKKLENEDVLKEANEITKAQ